MLGGLSTSELSVDERQRSEQDGGDRDWTDNWDENWVQNEMTNVRKI